MDIDDKFKITIRIADIPAFMLTIRRDEEEYYRRGIEDINKLWSNWKERVKDNDSNKIIVVIALKFAKQFYEILAQMKLADEQHNTQEREAKMVLENFEKELDKILLDINKKV